MVEAFLSAGRTLLGIFKINMMVRISAARAKPGAEFSCRT